MERHQIDDVRVQLLRRAYLYTDATAFEAGVNAALGALAESDQSDDMDQLAEVLSVTR